MKTTQNITLVMTQDNMLYNKALTHYLKEFCRKTFSDQHVFHVRSFFSAESGANNLPLDTDIIIIDQEVQEIHEGNPGYRILKKCISMCEGSKVVFVSPRQSFSTALVKIKDAIRKHVYKQNAYLRAG